MTYYLSICKEPGCHGKLAVRVPLDEVVSFFPQMAEVEKCDNWLVYGGFVDVPGEYLRNESEDIMKMNVVLIDCDNDEGDPDILSKFHKDMEGYRYVTWETYSSTKERPKFRALVPLDATIKYDKYVKRAVFKVFSDYTDQRASWFFTPDKGHLHTLQKFDGKPFSSASLLEVANDIRRKDEEFERRMEAYSHAREKMGVKFDSSSWRCLPSVKKCLEGLSSGERQSSLAAACYAMSKYGYKSSIPEFLGEVVASGSQEEFERMKRELARRYR